MPRLLYMLAQAQRTAEGFRCGRRHGAEAEGRIPDDARGCTSRRRCCAIAASSTRRLRVRDVDEARARDGSLVYEYANLLERAGRIADAERALRDVLAKDPQDANALNSLGYMLAEHGERLDEAVDLVQRALKIEPANPSFLDSLGWAYFRQGKLDLADAPLTQAAERLPTQFAVQEHLGDLRFKQERFADAAAALERSLAGDGESIDRAKVEKKVRDARQRVKR